MAKRFFRAGKSTTSPTELPATATVAAPKVNPIAAMFGRAQTARRLTAQEIYAALITHLADGLELTPEQESELERVAREIGADAAAIEADVAGLKSLAKARDKLASYDAAKISVELSENGTRLTQLREELRAAKIRFNVLTNQLHIQAALARGVAEQELKLWRVLNGAPETDMITQRNEAHLRDAHRQSFGNPRPVPYASGYVRPNA